jgi:hypothetical protein
MLITDKPGTTAITAGYIYRTASPAESASFLAIAITPVAGTLSISTAAVAV